MDYPSGLVLDAILTAKVAFISTGGTMKMCSKGDKAFTLVEMKYKGEMLREEDGFDGEQQWEYTQASGKNEKDNQGHPDHEERLYHRFRHQQGV